MISKKGQSMSVNVIIVAALALVVLVVLIVIFTSRTAEFDKRISKEGESELLKMKIQYGDCRPTVEQENNFKVQFSQAANEVEGEQAVVNFQQEINRCKDVTEQTSCEGQSCIWG